ncbi:MAG: phage tail tape measure protein [Alphaproteobacteria bacterium]|nr:phage tail tape measure protein [Alphaproteobacteria bacterium]
MALTTLTLLLQAKDEASQNLEAVNQKAGGANVGMLAIGGAAAAAGVAVIGFASEAVNAYGDFDKAITNINARVDLTGDELDGISDKAKQMGIETAFSATDAANAMLQLVTTGSSVEETMVLVEDVLNLAAASGGELEKTADDLTDIMAVFSIEAEHAGGAVDTLVAGAGSSSATVEDLSAALANGGAVAASMGLDLEETVAILSTFAEAGIKGSEAGTQMRSMLLNMRRDTESTDEAWNIFNTSLYDAEGNIRDLDTVFKEINDEMASGKRTQEEYDLAMQGLFGSYGIVGSSALLAADGITTMQEKMGEQRSAAEVAATQLESYQSRVNLLGSSMESLMIAVGEPLVENFLKPLVSLVTSLINEFLAWNRETDAIGTAFTVFGEVLNAVMEIVRPVFETLVANVGLVVGAFQQLASGDVTGALQSLAGVVGNAFNLIQSLILGGIGNILVNFSDFFTNLVVGAVTGLDALVKRFPLAFNPIPAFIHNTSIDVLEIAQNLLNGFLQMVEDFIRGVLQPIADQAGTIFDVGGVGSQAKQFLEGFDLTVDLVGGRQRISAESFGTPGLGIDVDGLRASLAGGISATGQDLIAQSEVLREAGSTVINIEIGTNIGDSDALVDDIQRSLRERSLVIG